MKNIKNKSKGKEENGIKDRTQESLY